MRRIQCHEWGHAKYCGVWSKATWPAGAGLANSWEELTLSCHPMDELTFASFEGQEGARRSDTNQGKSIQGGLKGSESWASVRNEGSMAWTERNW